ncbi:MAG: hypothetical protein JO147_11575 [Actinobacteria bacterium]|nr:hypothetical protein [Actinomycetota bacterium]
MSPARIPPDVLVEPAPPDHSLADLLLDGEIDAIYAPGAPAGYSPDDGAIRRLLTDPVRAERQYFRETQIFPPMHVLVLRRSIVRDHPQLPGELLTAFTAAKSAAAHAVGETAEVHAMEPWLYAHAETTRALMGEDFWPYGLEPNRAALTTFLRYAHEQGLTSRHRAPEELFDWH